MTSALMERLNLEDKAWVRSTDAVSTDMPDARDTDLIITVGGDGTIIRAAHLSVTHKIPILGINMGRLGFMTELRADEALDRVPEYLEGTTRVEERAMLQVSILPGRPHDGQGHQPAGDSANEGSIADYHALNDAVIGRGAVFRLIRIGAFIDGAHLTDFRADAVIASTPTGSTGYNLSVGGPILSPQASDIILKAVAPHVGIAPALVLPSSSVLELVVETDYQTILSVDGHIDVPLSQGECVRVQKSLHKALFLRGQPAILFLCHPHPTAGLRGRTEQHKGYPILTLAH